MIKVAWSPIYVHPLPANHRFPMEKYDLLPKQLIHEGTLSNENFFQPNPVTLSDVLSIHTKEYWSQLSNLNLNRKEQLRSGFPHSKQLIDRELIITGGSIQASLFALQNCIAFNIAGGTHHAFADRAEGFCLLNDIAIASSFLLRRKLVKQVLVVDLDVHQGNGTAKIFENNSKVYTFSMHADHNYPLKKEKSDLDVPLPDGIIGDDYLKLLKDNLKKAIAAAQPDFLFFQSGVDVLQTDHLGRLGLTIEDCKKRDEYVLTAAFENNIPLMACMGGGYSKEIKYIIEAHANTYRVARDIWNFA